jgi:aminopeptidase|tara:strand:- start:783 stop:1898 length:1116 start_codon:yes stop_codon:yes gene_type:complete
MINPQFEKLANLLITHSCSLEKGEKILIEAFDIPQEMVIATIRAARKAGGLPFVTWKNNLILKELINDTSEEHMSLIGSVEKYRMEQMDAYIGLRGSLNISEMSDVTSDKMAIYQSELLQKVHFQERVANTKWVVLRWPTPSMAQQANMSTEAFEKFYFDVCCLDYKKMDEAMKPLEKLMTVTEKVHIKGPGTDLRFSIKGIPAIRCAGERNIPDGECFTAPVKDSVEGHIQFNTETLYHGTVFNNIRLELKKGKIVKATGNDDKKINAILDSDEGARYIGEFAIAFNPYITEPMKDILFDEKIAGSFHFTPGNAYDIADNGNRSDVHWDMVLIQRPDYGGGEIWFDDILIRKDGEFILPELKGLNQTNLV